MDVAMIGAGPVGLFTALLLAQKGIRVTVCEAENAVDNSPRACVWFPPVLEELEKAGIVDEVIAAGERRGDGVDWRDADGKVLAGIAPPPNDPGFAVQLGQPEVCHIIIDKLRKLNNCELLFNHSFQSLEQKDGRVSYKLKNTQTAAETEKECDYLIGADGGKSSVRKSIGIRLEGFTWDDFQFVAVNFQYPLKDWNWKGGNYVLDPIDWAIIVKRGKNNQWRMATGVPKKVDERMASLDADITELIKRRLRRMLPGDTSKIEFEAMAPYIVHQRCAEKFREGNVLLAGDAAHLNSPVGALGLTTGMLDAAHLAQGLIDMFHSKSDTTMLNTYAESRRTIFKEYTEPKSRANFYRMYSQEPEHIQERDSRLSSLNDPKNLVVKSRAGPQWNGLSTISSYMNFLDTYKEITWFISVSKIPEWSQEKFEFEYKVVHANMTRKAHEMGAPMLGYDQVQVQSGDRSWDFVTCLQFPSLFVNWMGFKDPGYKANAGKHVFCRLDQQGCLTVKVREYRSGGEGGERVRALVFHRRASAIDQYPLDWLYKHGDEMVEMAEKDERILACTLYRDVTPKNAERYFEDTQFSGGSWLEFKAVEAFDFTNAEEAKAFLEKHVERFDSKDGLKPYVVIGKADKVV